MSLIVGALVGILEKPTLGDMAAELALLAATIGVAVVVGVLIGWAWRPRWASDLSWKRKPDLLRLDSSQAPPPGCCSSSYLSEEKIGSSSFKEPPRENVPVNSEDLEHLWRLVEVSDGGPVWNQMMNKSLPNMIYQAWRRDPEKGPPHYRTRTVFEDTAPEVVRDFFWDDEFRIKNKWDDMLLHHSTLEECPTTGAMVVHWIRKFPFFCSDREYIIGRRIWESGRTYYCVTKGVPSDSIPRKNKPRRVDLYYSSWCIRPAESSRGDGQLTACEVLLFHYEDMGIPWEIAKLGVRQGMWATVQRIEPGLRAYQKSRSSDEPPSRCTVMARMNTKVDVAYLRRGLDRGDSPCSAESERKDSGSAIPKLILIGGVVAIACSLDRGLLTKAVIFGAARRFANLGKRM